jgi:hypothetical protein
MLRKLTNKFFKGESLKGGDVYAVQAGDYVGELWIYMESDDDNHYFLAPNKVNREIPKEKFDFGKEHDIIEFVENTPKHIYKVLKEQYRKNG